MKTFSNTVKTKYAARRYGMLATLVLAAVLAGPLCGQKQAGPVVDMLKKKDVMIVDVRTPGEFASGAYPGAVNIPLSQLSTRMSELGDKGRPIVLYCASGNRSGQALQMLTSSGYSNLVNGGGLRDMPALK